MYQPDLKLIYKRLKSSAKRRDIPFELTLMELYDMGWPITCPVLGIPLKFNRGRPGDDSYSFDRKDSKLGYHIDNLVIVSYKANRLKSNAHKDELTALANFYQEL